MHTSPRSGRQPAAVCLHVPAAAGGRGEAAADVPPGAAVAGRGQGGAPGAAAGGRRPALRPGQSLGHVTSPPKPRGGSRLLKYFVCKREVDVTTELRCDVPAEDYAEKLVPDKQGKRREFREKLVQTGLKAAV